MILPNTVIIGAEKSASTYVQDCLSDHPEVFMVENEIPYFEDPEFFETSFEDFSELFSDVSNEKVIGIKRPSYFSKKECPERIANLIPEAKIIVILRNPVERLLSSYFHNIKYGFFPVVHPEKGLRELIAGKYTEEWPRSNEVIDFSYYHKPLCTYIEKFRKNILILFHHNFLIDSREQMKIVYQFLYIDDKFVSRADNTRPQSVVYSLPRLRFLTLKNKHMFDYFYNNTRLSVKTMGCYSRYFCRLIDAIDTKILIRMFGDNRKPKLSEDLEEILYGMFSSDVKNLMSLLNVDLRQWEYPN